MKKITIVILLVLGVVFTAYHICSSHTKPLAPQGKSQPQTRKTKKKDNRPILKKESTDPLDRAKKFIKVPKSKDKEKGKPHLVIVSVEYKDRDDLSKDEKIQLTAIQMAQEEEDLQLLLEILPAARASSNAEVRSELVDALGWFGESAMLELLPFMVDKDEDIAQSAKDNWTTALADVENEKERATLIESAMSVLHDEDSLDAMVAELNDCDELMAMQTVVNIIDSPNKDASAAARRQYEFMTGEDYVDLDTAEKWLRANYTVENADGSVSTMAEREEVPDNGSDGLEK